MVKRKQQDEKLPFDKARLKELRKLSRSGKMSGITAHQKIELAQLELAVMQHDASQDANPPRMRFNLRPRLLEPFLIVFCLISLPFCISSRRDTFTAEQDGQACFCCPTCSCCKASDS